jgi:hypothetical protein
MIQKQNPEAAKLMEKGLPYALHNLGDGGLRNLAKNLDGSACPILSKDKATRNKIKLFKIAQTDTCLDALLKITLPVIEIQKIMKEQLAIINLRQPQKRFVAARLASPENHRL